MACFYRPFFLLCWHVPSSQCRVAPSPLSPFGVVAMAAVLRLRELLYCPFFLALFSQPLGCVFCPCDLHSFRHRRGPLVLCVGWLWPLWPTPLLAFIDFYLTLFICCFRSLLLLLLPIWFLVHIHQNQAGAPSVGAYRRAMGVVPAPSNNVGFSQCTRHV